MERFFVKNFGCRAAQADGAAIEAGLANKGMESAGSYSEADVIVLNSCTVTATADDDLRQAVRRARREQPLARIVVTGCYAQRAPEEIAKLPGVSMVVGNSHKTGLPDLVARPPKTPDYHGEIEIGEIHSGDIFAAHEFLSAPIEDAAGDRTRPNLKIQDGCNNRCSFCIIPFVRGRSRSATPEQVIGEVRTLASRYREVVLSGINLGRWGRDFTGLSETLPAGRKLPWLVKRLLDETPIERLRLSSVEPMDFSDDLLQLMADSHRIAKHVHAPLQSGSDTVLRRMHRKYRPKHFEERVRKARALMPGAAIGADVMTGFPGESDSEFEDSYAFIEAMPFTYLHVFTYSERPGTPAAERDQVPQALRKERTHALRALAAAKNRAFRQSMIGQTLSVVTLDGGRRGLSDNYIKVDLARARGENQLVDVVIGGATTDGVSERGAFTVLAS